MIERVRLIAQGSVHVLKGRWGDIDWARRLTRATLAMSREELDLWVSERLGSLLREIASSVPYYSDLIYGRNHHRDGRSVLRSLPVLMKSTVRREFERLISRRIPRRRILFSATGGSTGEPMSFGRDLRRVWLSNVEQELGLSWAGRPPAGRVLSIWGSVPDVDRNAGGWRQMWNSTVHGLRYLPAFRIPTDPVPWVKAIDRFKPHVIVGYAGALAHFGALCRRRGVSPEWTPRGIISSAESLAPDARVEIEGVFRAPVLDRYGSRELGTVAHECERRQGMHVFEHGKVVELLDPDDQPVHRGDPGRIVVTDLWNRGFPLVRYDTGDVGVEAEGACPCGRPYTCLRRVEGRLTDFLVDAAGTAISGLALPHVFALSDLRSIERFQAVQAETGEIVVRVVAPDGLPDEDRERILQVLRAQISGVPISVRLVSEISVPPSGKHRPVISHRSPRRLS